MARVVGLLRAVNVGGTGKLPMSDLRTLCESAGYGKVSTYIASGNVVFETEDGEADIKRTLEAALTKYAGKPMEVMVRTAAEMAAIRDANPFPDAPGSKVAVVFLDAAPQRDADLKGQADEEIGFGTREVYIHYPSGMGRSKLVIKGLASGTARNINTVAKLAEMAAGTD